MRKLLAVLAGFMVFSTPSHAQLRVGIRGGVTMTTALLKDSIVQPLSVKPGIAPTIGFSLETDLDSAWSLSLGLGTAWSSLKLSSPGNTEEVVPLTVWTPTLSISRGVAGPMFVRGVIGAAVYDPDHTPGTLFSEGSPIEPLVGLSVGWRRSLGNGMHYAVEAGYDAHRFTTRALQGEGFSGQQSVHRVSLWVSISKLVTQ